VQLTSTGKERAMKRAMQVLGIGIVLWHSGIIRAGNLLANPSFETALSTSGGSGDWPSDVGYWSGDNSQIVDVSDGIAPLDGTNMLQLLNAGGPIATSYHGSEVTQLVDVSTFHSDIAQGKLLVIASAYFNRVSGDAETDTAFGVRIRACSGSPTTFRASRVEITRVDNFISSDGDLATWERASVELLLPEGTDYIGIDIYADENVRNDTSGIEFDGHYADAVLVKAVPEPTTLALLALGGMALVRRRKRKTCI